MLLDDNQMKYLSQNLGNDVMAGYKCLGTSPIKLRMGDNEFDAIAAGYEQSMFPYYNDNRRDSFTNVELVFLNDGDGFHVMESSSFNDSLTTVQYFNSTDKYRNDPIGARDLLNMLSFGWNNLEDKDTFVVLNSGSIAVNTDNQLNSFVYAANTILGLRSMAFSIAL